MIQPVIPPVAVRYSREIRAHNANGSGEWKEEQEEEEEEAEAAGEGEENTADNWMN